MSRDSFLDNLMQGIKTFISWIVAMVVGILSMFGINIRKHGNRSMPNTGVQRDHDYYNDEYDYVKDVLSQPGVVTENKDTTEETVLKRKVENSLIESIAVYRDGNILSLMLPESSNKISTMSTLITQEFEETEFLVVGNRLSAVTKIKYAGYKVYLTCSHVIQMMDHESLEGFTDINPMICSKDGKIKENLYVFRVEPKTRVIWYTRNAATGKYVYIETEVFDVITCPIIYYKRRVLMTIALIVAMQPDEVYITSGTLMSASNNPYIVTYKKTNTKGVLYLVAVAPLTHEYRIQIV